jgi:hypothetical protein
MRIKKIMRSHQVLNNFDAEELQQVATNTATQNIRRSRICTKKKIVGGAAVATAFGLAVFGIVYESIIQQAEPTPAPLCQLLEGRGQVCGNFSLQQVHELEVSIDNLTDSLNKLPSGHFPRRLYGSYTKLICNDSDIGEDWDVFQQNFIAIKSITQNAEYQFINHNHDHYSALNLGKIELYPAYDTLSVLPQANLYFYNSKLRITARELFSLTHIPRYNTNNYYLYFNEALEIASNTICDNTPLINNTDSLSFFISSAFLLYNSTPLNVLPYNALAFGKMNIIEIQNLKIVAASLSKTLNYLASQAALPSILESAYQHFICNDTNQSHWRQINHIMLSFNASINEEVDFIFPVFNHSVICSGEIARTFRSTSQRSEIYLCDNYLQLPTLYMNSSDRETENRTKLQIIAHEFLHIIGQAEDQYYGYNNCTRFANLCGTDVTHFNSTINNIDCLAFFIQSAYSTIPE